MKNKIYKNVGMFGHFWKKNKFYVDMYFGTGERAIKKIKESDRYFWELQQNGLLMHHRDGKFSPCKCRSRKK